MQKFVFVFYGVLALAGGVYLRFNHETILETQGLIQRVNLLTASIENKLSSTLSDPRYSLLFMGDIMLSRSVGKEMFARNDFEYPFLKIADTIRAADFAFANLEGPISNRGANQGSKYSFRANPRATEGLTHAGFDALSVANNHILDWGTLALEDTLQILKENKIAPIGAGRNYEEANEPKIFILGDLPARINDSSHLGGQFALLAYTNLYPQSLEAGIERAGVSEWNLKTIQEKIAVAKKENDLVIVSLHWGEEYASHPSEIQRNIARSLVDAGADLIIGHHPHVVQDIERYKDSYIFYSLGNFVFDQTFSKATSEGIMAKIVIQNKKIESVESIEIKIGETFQPELKNP